MDIICVVVQVEDIFIVVLDSVLMLMFMKEQEKFFEDSIVVEQVKLIIWFLCKVNQIMINEWVWGYWLMFILINQWWIKIGVMFGDNWILLGGNFLNYVCVVQVEVMNKEKVGKFGDGFGVVERNEYFWWIKKNKVINGL